jgi:hypothetical protein
MDMSKMSDREELNALLYLMWDAKDYKALWADLGDVPVNDDGDIEEEWLGFPAGTDREEIWQWFEEEFGISVAEDLMYRTGE